MTIEAMCARESDFSDFVQYADEQELLRQQRILKADLQKLEMTRSPVTELMRDRLKGLDLALGLAA